MTHSIDAYADRPSFSFIVPHSPEPAVWVDDVLPMPTTARYDTGECRESKLVPETPGFRAWDVSIRGRHWTLCGWRVPSLDALLKHDMALHGADAIELRPHEWTTNPTEGRWVTMAELVERTQIAVSFDDRRGRPPVPHFAYGLRYVPDESGTPYGGMLLSAYSVQVSYGRSGHGWQTMGEAWDAAINRISGRYLREEPDN